MAIALRGYCPECGKVAYLVKEDALLAAKLYTALKGQLQDVYPGCGVWHLRDHAKKKRTDKQNRKRRKRRRHLTHIASLLHALVARQNKRAGSSTG